MLAEAEQKDFDYVKRFCFERTAQTRQLNFLGDNPASRLVLLTDQVYPRISLVYGGADAFRDPMVVDVEEYIAVKGFKAKGKRLTTCTVERVDELEPTRFPEPEPEEQDEETEGEALAESGKQPSLFDEA